MRLIRCILAALSLMFGASAVHAACTLSPNVAADLGSASSYTVRGGAVAQIASAPALSCSGAVIGVLTTNYARVSGTSGTGFKLRSSTGDDAIAYRLSADPGGAYPLNSGATIDYFDPNLISLLGFLGSSDFAARLHIGLLDMPNVAAGTYSDTVTLAWSWRICSGIGVGGICIGYYEGTGSVALRITLVVTNDCRIAAPPVLFEAAPLADRFRAVTQTAAVDCTKGARFAIAFSEGTGGSARPWRTMSDGLGHHLRYNIFRSDGATIWDTTNPLPDARPGTGGTIPSLLKTSVARIDPPPPTPPPGIYRDTIVMTVSF
ncbi:MAG: spore coat U domain-containing protein [Erythrobacter sp.]|nr:spore coat U domain-containing protein [Erythrobacter sp.]